MPIDPSPPPPTTGPYNGASGKPILIELHQADKTKSGHFRPVASLKIMESFRTGGLLSALPAEDLKSLLFLLTFVSPNGDCGAAIHQLCAAMRLSALKVRRRMGRLVTFHWAGAPLVVEHRRATGLTVYAPHPALVAHAHVEPRETPPESAQRPVSFASREAVIAHSRANYTAPRAVVEKRILDDWLKYRSPGNLARLGIKEAGSEQPADPASPKSTPAGDSTEQDLLQRLVQVGLTYEQAANLVRHHDRLRIERQLQWLPFRNANKPAGFLLAAVADNYEAPISLRHRAAVSAETPGPPPGAPPEPAKESDAATLIAPPGPQSVS